MTKAKVAVIGAGVVGLSTALNIIDTFPEVCVTIIADKFNQDTTSSGAAGLYRPNMKNMDMNPQKMLKKWFMDTRQHYFNLFNSPTGCESGVNLITGFLLFNEPLDKFSKELYFSYHELSSEERQNLGFKYSFAYEVTSVIAESWKYLPWLMNKFRARGGHVEKRTLMSFEELVGHYDVVVNCAGLNNRYILNDQKMEPVKGQLIQVEAPWVKHFYFASGDTYVIPWVAERQEAAGGASDASVLLQRPVMQPGVSAVGDKPYTFSAQLPLGDIGVLDGGENRVILGGIRLRGDYTMHTDPGVSKKILDGCTQLLPSLKHAKILSEWAGLRPHRNPLRVEKETMQFDNRVLKVVHNYGHGAHGISLSWGTALRATCLLGEFLQTNQPAARL